MEILDEKIINYYQEEKLSVQQVADRLHIPTNRIYRILDSNNIPRRSRSEAVRYSHITRLKSKQFEPKKELSPEDIQLKIAGVMLYWGEGTKQNNTVALSNSNPELVGLYLRFLRSICGIDESRLHVTLHYYEDQNPEELIEFWSDRMAIESGQFYKSFLHKRKNTGTYRKPSLYGTVSVQYSDKKLLEIILTWIKDYSSLAKED